MQPANIPRLEVRDYKLSPVEAEIWITIPDALAEMQLRGRLMGPRCHYATTVEVAYPLRFLPGQLTRPGELTARVVIPEPSLWDPESPFLYEGSVEVWKEGRRWYDTTISHGLRTLQLRKGQLHCNGRALSVRGVIRRDLSERDALELRQEGYNTLVATVGADTAPLWDAADRLGFLVLGRLPDTHAAFLHAASLRSHACCLGWLLPEATLGQGALSGAKLSRLQSESGLLLGLEVDHDFSGGLPQGFHFLVAKEDVPRGAGQPVLLKGPHPGGVGEEKDQAAAASGILGRIAE